MNVDEPSQKSNPAPEQSTGAESSRSRESEEALPISSADPTCSECGSPMRRDGRCCFCMNCGAEHCFVSYGTSVRATYVR